MKRKRLFQTIRLWTISSGKKRAEYLRSKHIFASIGDNCSIMDRKVPLYAGLIKLGNNVHLASNVTLVAHDITHRMLNNLDKEHNYQEAVGCIDIGNNCFIGSGVIILSNVKIGDNVIIGAGALVCKDIPSNCVVGGVPAKIICPFEEYMKNRQAMIYPTELAPKGQVSSKSLEEYMWNQFYENRSSK